MRSNFTMKNIVNSALLLALGVVLPQVFHVFGQASGQTLLPIHIPVLLTGFICGPVFGLIVGILTPILSHLFTGMPPMSPMPVLLFMLIELPAYGFFSGMLYKKYSLNVYISLIIAMLAGRIVNGVGMAIFVAFLSLPINPIVSVLSSIAMGLPGIAIQIIIIPVIVTALKKAGYIRVEAHN